MTALYEVSAPKGETMWCGPTSISAVTGLDYMEVREAIRVYRDDPAGREIGAMCDHELVGVLGFLGWCTRSFDPFFGYSRLGRYIHTLSPFDHAEILTTATHFTAISYTDMVDTKTCGKIVPLHMAPRMWTLIEHAIEVRPIRARARACIAA